MLQACLSLFGTTAEVCSDIASHPEASLYEVRLDLSDQLDLPRIRAAASRPLILASHYRPDLLPAAAPFADYLDVGPHPARDSRSIVSVHAAEGDADLLWSQHSGDHITKIVLESPSYYTISRLLALNRSHAGRALCFAMGEVGSFSRILSGFYGAPWIYASLEGRPTAAGQFTLRELVHTYQLSRFSSAPAVFGVVGDPVSHSRSPAFHNARFAESGLPWVYVPMLCRDLVGLFAHALDFGIAGLSVTHPHKAAVIPFLDVASEDVRRLRSCNTICFLDGRRHGINTDLAGIRALLQDVPLAGVRMALLGAGGSARAVADVVRPQVRELHILSRSIENSQRLASEFEARAHALDQLTSLPYDILFQTTPVGMKAGECPVPPDALRPGSIVIDSIYRPAETELLKRARALGCRTLNGEAWFVAQAEAQFQWWRSMLSGS